MKSLAAAIPAVAIRPAAIFLLTIALVGGCEKPTGGSKTSSASQPAGRVTALVAASAQDAVNAIARQLAEESNLDVKVSPGASSALANQIMAGAPADVFLSASPEWVTPLVERDLVEAQRPLLTNRLVIIVPANSSTRIQSAADLLATAAGRVALAGENVPAGKYAEQALRHAGVYETLQADRRIVRGQDVRFTLGFVERGEADAGVVYATDARAAGERVRVVYEFPRENHDPIIYPLVLLKTAPNPAAARRFYEALALPAAQDIFRAHGFMMTDAH